MKHSVNNLALFGGAPAFDQKLYVGCPNMGERTGFLTRINAILDRKWLTNDGVYLQEFEKRVAAIVGAKHCIAVSSGTTALEIAIRATELVGEVIIPSFTFVALAHALQWQEITPVFCDVERSTCNIDPREVERLITPRTAGIIGVHLWGRPCDVEALTQIADHHGLKLLFDASHAFGCSYKGRMLGHFGLAEIFSFHATKFVSSGEGGAVMTNDDELAKKVRLMRNFGFIDYDTVDYIGINGKMNEMSAALGLTSLESMDDFIEVNKQNYEQYIRELKTTPGISFLTYDGKEKCNFQYIVFMINEKTAQISRDQLLEILWKENIIARRYFFPGCHRMEPYKSLPAYKNLKLPQTETISNQILCLPTGTAVTEQDITKICEIIRRVISQASEVKVKLACTH